MLREKELKLHIFTGFFFFISVYKEAWDNSNACNRVAMVN